MDDENSIDSTIDSQRIEELKDEWLKEQDDIKAKITTVDDRDWIIDDNFLVGGLDISFIVGDNVNACACYVVLNRKFEKVYEETKMVKMTAPYIPGFLAFREADFLCDLVHRQMRQRPEVTPSVLMMDGNGILHPNRAGISSHIGVKLSMPSIGVAKNLHMLPELGEIDRKKIAGHLTFKGDVYNLTTDSEELLGRALKTVDTGLNPVFVSVGTGLSLESAVKLVLEFSVYRVPEPTRQADIVSREFLRIHHPTARQMQPKKQSKPRRKSKEQSE